jgi:putative transposase
MSQNFYAAIPLHIVWHTKASAPLLIPKVEAVVHHYIRGRCINTRGVYIHEIGGIETHVHLCVSIPPTLLISEFIGQLKGASAHETNQKLADGRKLLEWQTGYGVVSFGTKDLEWVKAYVRNQRERHARGAVEDRLERIMVLAEAAEAERREAPFTGLKAGVRGWSANPP